MMLKSFVRAAAPFVPTALGRLPYSASLTALKHVVPGASVWARNSYLTPTFTPGVSDLDLTIWFDSPPEASQLRELTRILRWGKTLFPALGEANVYEAGMGALLRAHLNPLLLSRDPQLERRLGNRRIPSAAERATFLMRALDADAQNLMTAPQLREGKWREHFRSAEAPFDPGAISGLRDRIVRAITLLAEPADAAGAALLERALSEYYREAHDTRDKWEFVMPRSLNLVFSHRFPYLRPEAPLEPSWLSRLIVAQLSWELTGLLSQALLAPDSTRPITEGHCDKIVAYLALVPGGEELSNGFLALKKWVMR